MVAGERWGRPGGWLLDTGDLGRGRGRGEGETGKGEQGMCAYVLSRNRGSIYIYNTIVV